MTDLDRTLPAEETDDLDKSKAPLLDHLIELRRRLLWSFLALALAFGLCLYFVDQILAVLVQPLLAAGQRQLIAVAVFEQFFVRIKVAFFGALMISFPVLASQIWLFVAPGLYRKERRAFLPFLVLTPFLFAAGASLAYFVAMPLALNYLLGFAGNIGGVEQTSLPGISNYLDFWTRFIFGFGVAFLLPVLLMLLERAGLVTRQQLKRGRRYAIVVAFIVAAVLTPPDVISQLLLAVPLVVLYEVSLIAIWFTERKRVKAAAGAPTA
ncbi:MAG TPA: twin-arginine translocase subunit TatC [Allosphingosinicella sp.]|nr:twin-arginine translocase subunit TatC [Allosphingosinicella sp.]